MLKVFLGTFPWGIKEVPESMRERYVNPTKSILAWCVYAFNHVHMRIKRIMGILVRVSEECVQRRHLQLRIFARKEKTQGRERTQATTHHHGSKFDSPLLMLELHNPRTLCHPCHTQRTNKQNVCRRDSAENELLDWETTRILKVHHRSSKYIDNQRMSRALARIREDEGNEISWYDKWETSKEGICATYGRAHSTLDSFVGWCESCLKNYASDVWEDVLASGAKS